MPRQEPLPRKESQPRLSTEIERKFDVDDAFSLPDLDGLPGVARVSQVVEHRLDATYFDTADLRLLAARHTLRRRTGGVDAGWHLKRPRTDGDRDEIRCPLGRSTRTVPKPLQDLVAVHTRGAALGPVVRLATTRRVRELLATDGAVLAEVAFDEVSASVPSSNGRRTSVSAWHEVEVELVGGRVKLLAAVGRRLIAAGATPSASHSKVGRALADRRRDATTAGQPGQPADQDGVAARPVLPQGSAGAVVLAYLQSQVEHLVRHDPLVRSDEPDAVHQLRVACRRLRSALATFRPLFDRTVTDPIRDELAWLGGELGAARDAEVVREHLVAAAQAEPPDLLLGPVVARIVATMDARYRAAHDEALTELNGARYFALLDALDALVATPPLRQSAFEPAPVVLLPLAHRSWARTRRLVEQADAAEPPQRDLLLHEVRKAAKRARYAGESLTAAFGKPAARFASTMAAIQEVLGDHQDSVVVREVLQGLALAAFAAGENAFSYGRLHALEQARAERTEHAFLLAWARALDPSHREWLR